MSAFSPPTRKNEVFGSHTTLPGLGRGCRHDPDPGELPGDGSPAEASVVDAPVGVSEIRGTLLGSL